MEDPPVPGAFAAQFSFSELVTGFNASDFDPDQYPESRDDQNNAVVSEQVIRGLQTNDNRVLTTSVTPQTSRVAHRYTLTLTVPGGTGRSSLCQKAERGARDAA